VLRYPKGKTGAQAEAVGKLGSMDILRFPQPDLTADVLLVGAGPMAVTGAAIADRLATDGIGTTVVDPRWLKPLDNAMVPAARQHRMVAVIEDNGEAGGFGDAVCREFRRAGIDTPVRTFALPQRFLDQGTRDEILEDAGLTAPTLAAAITAQIKRLAQNQLPSPVR
jgi:1-deoxy-D-xylulose-5-phosphate synthase